MVGFVVVLTFVVGPTVVSLVAFVGLVPVALGSVVFSVPGPHATSVAAAVTAQNQIFELFTASSFVKRQASGAGARPAAGIVGL